MASVQRSFYLLNVRAICTIFPHKWTQCIVLLFCYKCLLEKVTMQRIQLSFFFAAKRTGPKNLVECSACVVSWKNCDWVKSWLLGDMPISWKPPIRISRNLTRKYFKKLVTGGLRKQINFKKGNSRYASEPSTRDN